VREIGRRSTRALGGESSAGFVTSGIALLGAVVLVATLAAGGPRWSPGRHAPWSHGWLHAVVRVL
jgi:hypothetical protein